jgi:N12 class adenine-specific DNA methylase
MTTTEIRQAMSTLRQFSEKERDYHTYQARQNYLRQQETIQYELDEERKAKEEALKTAEEALKAKNQAIQAKNDALAEIERLKALLDEKNKAN